MVVKLSFMSQFYFETEYIRYVSRILCVLGMQPHMNLVKIIIFLIDHVIVRPTRIIKRDNKNCVHLKKNKVPL